ncbi:MSS51 [Sanghuangporus vaninii]
MAWSLTARTALQRARCPARVPRNLLSRREQTRTFLSALKKKQPEPKQQSTSAPPPRTVLSQNDLFHPFSKSPFPDLHERAEAIKKLAQCPVCASSVESGHPHARRRHVAFECPDCGWPTHCSEEHWAEDEHHQRYCGRLHECNEDEHDLRSGRKMTEFELPGPMHYDETISFANWDIFWYTRGFPSMDTERMRRNASKLLTYPMTVASVLHQNSGLTLSNQRVTPEGIRSLAAVRSTLHVPTGSPETEEAGVGKPVFRVFVLGARAESSLPPHVWEQLSLLFPAVSLQVLFVGPQVSLPRKEEMEKLRSKHVQNDTSTKSEAEAEASRSPTNAAADSDKSGTTSDTRADDAAPVQDVPEAPKSEASSESKSTYLPNVYEPPTPAPIPVHSRTRSSVSVYGAPSYTLPFAPQISITGIQAKYNDIHPALADSLDPYTDVFFFFCPGFGFPSASGALSPTGQPLLQVNSPTEWGGTLQYLLQSKCAIFVTGFSPADVERDVRSLATAEGVAGEFDWVITPGENPFGSEKWEVADFDPRVMVKTNWGIWGIRGKRRDIKEWERR